MLYMIDKAEVPGYRNGDKCPLRVFCEKTAREFLEMASPGDVAEVTCAPVEPGEKGVWRLAGAFRTALFYMDRGVDLRREVRVITRGGERVFLERAKHPAPTARRELNPYPDHVRR